jgi:hypothetical protein
MIVSFWLWITKEKIFDLKFYFKIGDLKERIAYCKWANENSKHLVIQIPSFLQFFFWVFSFEGGRGTFWGRVFSFLVFKVVEEPFEEEFLVLWFYNFEF